MSNLYHKLQNTREQTRGKTLSTYVYYFKYDFCWNLSFESQMYLEMVTDLEWQVNFFFFLLEYT